MPKEIKYPWQIGRFSLFTGIEPGQNPSLIKSQDWRDAVQNEALEVLFTANIVDISNIYASWYPQRVMHGANFDT